MNGQETEVKVEEAAAQVRRVQDEIGKAFIGQKELLDKVLITLLAGGHLLVEGVPGLGKTLMVRALAKVLGGDAKRVQFTPDLMPSDITGHMLFDMNSSKFLTRKGPIFSNMLIADEINRAPAKTQAALFEAMQEFQVSIDGKTFPLPKPFLTMATQNPFEHEGTYPLPDAQKDRFLMKVLIEYPALNEESEMVSQITGNGLGENLSLENINQITDIAGLQKLQDVCSQVTIDPSIVDYAVKIVRATREHSGLLSGSGPRGSIALVRTARAKALLQERNYVIPDDIKSLALPVLRHRISLSPESEIEGLKEDDIIEMILQQTKAPRD